MQHKVARAITGYIVVTGGAGAFLGIREGRWRTIFDPNWIRNGEPKSIMAINMMMGGIKGALLGPIFVPKYVWQSVL